MTGENVRRTAYFVWKRIPSRLKEGENFFALYIVLLILVGAYYFMRWPIVALDTDLWYHLNGGRYIAEHWRIPTESFFSFLSPPRAYVDYYWLFQVLVYSIYKSSGYYGLIAFRALAYCATTALIFWYLFNRKGTRAPVYFVILFFLSFAALMSRSQAVRPHLTSYFFIIAFLYVLEFGSIRSLFLLPLMALLWTNMHGIYYPLLILIVLSYLVELSIRRFRRGTSFATGEKFYLAICITSLALICATPHGFGLIHVPFVSTEYASSYIKELRRLNPYELLSFQITDFVPNGLTAFNFLLMLSCLSVLHGLARKTLRISHLLLFLGGLLMLSKGNRSVNECVLLALPVLRANIPFTLPEKVPWKIKPVRPILLLMLLVVPFLFVRAFFYNPPHYPFSVRYLPVGAATFLNRIESRGAVLSHQDTGGYLEWMLYPRYRIFMDMEVPFLFTDEDFQLSNSVFANKAVLGSVISKYRPPFIAAPLGNMRFKELIGNYRNYVPVFFDDVTVLYVDAQQYPQVAKQYALREVDPFTLAGGNVGLVEEKTRARYLKELLAVIQVCPDIELANEVAARIYLVEKSYANVLPHAEAIIRNWPEVGVGFQLKAEALKELGRYQGAISNYEKALKTADPSIATSIYRNMSSCYSQSRDRTRAYVYLRKAVNPFSPGASHTDLYDLGVAALDAGRPKEARTYLTFALVRVPEDDAAWKQKISEKLETVSRQRPVRKGRPAP
jgi:hypothetical protein